MADDRPGRRLVSVGFGTLTLSAATSRGLSVHPLHPPDQGSVDGVAPLPALLPAGALPRGFILTGSHQKSRWSLVASLWPGERDRSSISLLIAGLATFEFPSAKTDGED
jgi:hypothetical protein